MKKSKLRKIIREIISQEVPRSADHVVGGGRCAPIQHVSIWDDWLDYHRIRNIPCHPPHPRHTSSCTSDEDCPEKCWCNHPGR